MHSKALLVIIACAIEAIGAIQPSFISSFSLWLRDHGNASWGAEVGSGTTSSGGFHLKRSWAVQRDGVRRAALLLDDHRVSAAAHDFETSIEGVEAVQVDARVAKVQDGLIRVEAHSHFDATVAAAHTRNLAWTTGGGFRWTTITTTITATHDVVVMAQHDEAAEAAWRSVPFAKGLDGDGARQSLKDARSANNRSIECRWQGVVRTWSEFVLASGLHHDGAQGGAIGAEELIGDGALVRHDRRGVIRRRGHADLGGCAHDVRVRDWRVGRPFVQQTVETDIDDVAGDDDGRPEESGRGRSRCECDLGLRRDQNIIIQDSDAVLQRALHVDVVIVVAVSVTKVSLLCHGLAWGHGGQEEGGDEGRGCGGS